MSFIGDVTAALETLCRTALPEIPAGDDGVSLAIRLPSELGEHQLPHLVFGAEDEKAAPLRFRQRRTTAVLGIALVKRGATHGELLSTYGTVYTLYAADPSLGGVVETGLLELDGIHETIDDSNSLLRMTFTATKVF